MKCEYGCGQEALFTLKNGRNSCSRSANACPAQRTKNSQGLKDAYKEGRKKHVFTDEHRLAATAAFVDSTIDRVFVENSGSSNDTIKRLLLDVLGVKYECQRCGISEWQGERISLELDHINGNNRDNRIINLRLLCPNCHSLTPTWRGRGKNKPKVPDDVLMEALDSQPNIHQALLQVGLTGGGNYARAQRLLDTVPG